MAREFARVVRALHRSDALSSSRDAHDPRAFMRALDSRPPLDLFTDGDQHDSQEFLRFLLDALDEDLNAVTTPPPYSEEKDDFSEPESAKAARLWAKYRSRTSGVVVDVFAGQLRSAVTCHACGKASTSYDPFWDLSLPLRARRRREEDASSSSSSSTMRRSGSASLLSRYMGVGRSSTSSSSALSVTDCLEAFAEDEPLLGADAFRVAASGGLPATTCATQRDWATAGLLLEKMERQVATDATRTAKLLRSEAVRRALRAYSATRAKGGAAAARGGAAAAAAAAAPRPASAARGAEWRAGSARGRARTTAHLSPSTKTSGAARRVL